MKRFAAVLFYAVLAAWSVALGGVSNEIEFLVWAPRMLTAFFVTGVLFLALMLLFEVKGMDRLENYLAYAKTDAISQAAETGDAEENADTAQEGDNANESPETNK